MSICAAASIAFDRSEGRVRVRSARNARTDRPADRKAPMSLRPRAGSSARIPGIGGLPSVRSASGSVPAGPSVV